MRLLGQVLNFLFIFFYDKISQQKNKKNTRHQKALKSIKTINLRFINLRFIKNKKCA